jgi:hypothetical protein
MKKIFLITLLFLGANGFLFSQDTIQQKFDKEKPDEVQTLFAGKGHHTKISLGWYVGPTATYTQFGGKNAFMPGIEGGIIMNHFFSIGLAGSITANVNNLYFHNVQDTMGACFIGGYAGVKLEFTVFPKFPVHFSFPLLIGGGGSAYLHQYNYLYDNNWHNYNSSDYKVLDWNSFFILEPGIRAEVNIVKFLRFWVGGTYRWVPNYKLMNTNSDFMSNFNLSAGLKFGKF